MDALERFHTFLLGLESAVQTEVGKAFRAVAGEVTQEPNCLCWPSLLLSGSLRAGSSGDSCGLCPGWRNEPMALQETPRVRGLSPGGDKCPGNPLSRDLPDAPAQAATVCLHKRCGALPLET